MCTFVCVYIYSILAWNGTVGGHGEESHEAHFFRSQDLGKWASTPPSGHQLTWPLPQPPVWLDRHLTFKPSHQPYLGNWRINAVESIFRRCVSRGGGGNNFLWNIFYFFCIECYGKQLLCIVYSWILDIGSSFIILSARNLKFAVSFSCITWRGLNKARNEETKGIHSSVTAGRLLCECS